MKYFGPQTPSVPGVPSGAPATFRVRVWETTAGSYENAVSTGACYGEFPTVSGNGEVFVPALGYFGLHPTVPPLNGLLPLELPCVRNPTNSARLIPAIKLSVRTPSQGNLFRFEVLSGFLGKENIIQTSPDLINWTNLRTNVPSTNRFTFDLPVDTLQPSRWYRAVVREN
jgi:hypothetical protein